MTDELLRYVKQSDLDKGINYDNENAPKLRKTI